MEQWKLELTRARNLLLVFFRIKSAERPFCGTYRRVASEADGIWPFPLDDRSSRIGNPVAVQLMGLRSTSLYHGCFWARNPPSEP